MEKKTPNFKRCPRCGFKTFYSARVCGQCELNYDKVKSATNTEGKIALRAHEKERVIWIKELPNDVNKWRLFFLALFLGWTGAYLWKVGNYLRARLHFLGLLFWGIYFISLTFTMNLFWFNVTSFMGAFWLITQIFAVADVIKIAFNQFKVPVSLPYN